MNLSCEKILVTGATGFLGSHLCRRLIEEGAQVHAVSRSCQRQDADLCWWQGDMTDIAAVRNLFDRVKPNVVFHLSGLATADPDRELVLPTLQSLLVSAVNILLAAAENGCRRTLLAASLTEPQMNNGEITPGSPYAAAKWASGAYARMFHKLYDVPVVMVRPYMTYGPGQDPRKLIPYVILSLLREQAPKLSSGDQQIDWIYIDDVVDGFVLAAQAPNIEGQTIDLGSGVLVPIRAAVAQVVTLMEAKVKPLFGARVNRPFERPRRANTEDASQKLGWKPDTSLEAGLRNTIEWYRTKLNHGGEFERGQLVTVNT
jgi:UDP-glucose 4-epimerase